MKYWHGQSEIPKKWGKCVTTIGVFDGVHLGHSTLIKYAVNLGKLYRVPVVLMTFDPHPIEIIFPGSYIYQITNLTQKAKLAKNLGIDIFFVVPFTSNFMQLTPENYIKNLLIKNLNALEVVIGKNFTFGKKATGNVETLHKFGKYLGFGVKSTPMLMTFNKTRNFVNQVILSSTLIRSYINSGEMVKTALSLGHLYSINGIVIKGKGRGYKIGFPTANIKSTVNSAIPSNGIYAAWITILGNGLKTEGFMPNRRYLSAVSIGTNQTFHGTNRTIEVFIFNSYANLYGQYVTIEFVRKIRIQNNFNSVRDLILTMENDIKIVCAILCGY